VSALSDEKKESRLQVLRTLQSEYESERRRSDLCGQEHKKRRVDQNPRPAEVDEDQSIVGDERDDAEARCEDGVRMPSLGEVGRLSNDVSDREKMESTSVSTNGDDLDVISPSLLLALMKNHTVV